MTRSIPANPLAPTEAAALSAPLPTRAPETALVVGEDDIRFARGPRHYRVRGLARNLSAESLKVTKKGVREH